MDQKFFNGSALLGLALTLAGFAKTFPVGSGWAITFLVCAIVYLIMSAIAFFKK